MTREDLSVPPRHWPVPVYDVLLADGTIAVIRSLTPEDRDQVLALHEGVSEDTLRLRFFTPSPAAGRAYVAHLFDTSNTGSAALVAVIRGRVAALATAELLSAERAEVAFLVSDQDRGKRPGQPAARAPRSGGPRERRAPVRGRGTRRQLRDAAGCSVLPASRCRGTPKVARCRWSCAPRHPRPPSTPRIDASGAPRRAHCARCSLRTAWPWSASDATPGDWAAACSRPSGQLVSSAGSTSYTRRPTPSPACRSTAALTAIAEPVDLVVVVVPRTGSPR